MVSAVALSGDHAERPLSFVGQRGSLSTFGAFINLTKINWGVGMMSMPYMLSEAGLLTGVLFFVITMVLTCVSVRSLTRCREIVMKESPAQAGEYADLMCAVFGPWGRRLSIFSIFVANWGSLVAYTKWMGDNLTKFLPEAGLDEAAWIAVVAALWSLAAWLVDDVGFLRPFSYFGVLCGQLFALLIVVVAASVGTNDSGQSFGDFLTEAPQWTNLQGFDIAMGIAVFCNEGMVVLTPQVQGAMREPGCYWLALVAMCVYFTINYMAVAVCGFYLHFPQPASELTLDFDPSSAAMRVAVYLYALQLIMSYVVVYYVCYISLELACGVRKPTLRAKAARVLGIVIASVVAVLVRNFGTYIAFMGAIANTIGIYLLPNVGLLLLHRRGALKVGRQEVASAAVIVVFGVLTGSVATGSSFWDLVRGQGQG